MVRLPALVVILDKFARYKITAIPKQDRVIMSWIFFIVVSLFVVIHSLFT